LQSNVTNIPLFVVRIVSFLALIRRSNGNEFHFIQHFYDEDENLQFIKDFDDFKEYSEAMRDVCLKFD